MASREFRVLSVQISTCMICIARRSFPELTISARYPALATRDLKLLV